VSDPPNSASEYIWTSSGDVFDESSPSDDNEYVVSYDSASLQRIQVDVRDNRGFQVGAGEISIDVQEQSDDRDTENGGNGGQEQGWRITGTDTVPLGNERQWTVEGAPDDFEGIYNWDMGIDSPRNRNLNSTAENPSIEFTYTSAGEYTIEVTARSNLGLIEDEFTFEVEASNWPTSGLPMDEAASRKNREF
jgi:hypothetical protein